MGHEAKGQALLITGPPGCGKTTIVKKVAAAVPEMRLGGFVTGEIRQAGRRVGFELSTFAGDARLLAHVDIDSRDRVSRYGVDVEALDEIVWFPNCPHGRPIMTVLGEGELETRFLRR